MSTADSGDRNIAIALPASKDIYKQLAGSPKHEVKKQNHICCFSYIVLYLFNIISSSSASFKLCLKKKVLYGRSLFKSTCK